MFLEGSSAGKKQSSNSKLGQPAADAPIPSLNCGRVETVIQGEGLAVPK